MKNRDDRHCEEKFVTEGGFRHSFKADEAIFFNLCGTIQNEIASLRSQ